VPRSNSSEAAHELGSMHLTGDGVARDVGIALELFQSAAEHGHAEAQAALGTLYSTGFGVPHNGALAATYYHFAAEGGSTAAQLTLGYRHLLGVGSPKECEKALLYYDPVAERVVAGTQRGKAQQVFEKVRLSIDNPKGTSKHGAAEDEVIQYYEHSANKGSVDAALTLGHIHYHGARGVPVDVDRAFRYYSKAAVAGDPTAFSQLGNMYAQGIATEQDNATALEYFRKGAAKGHPPSQNSLGYMYMHGYGVGLSHKKALEYFKAAAEKGNADAQFNLGAMHIGGMGVKKAFDKALHYFTLSAHQGHTLALYNLGQMHLNGLGTPRSCTVAVQFLKAVAERGAWSMQLDAAHAALQGGDEAQPIQLYAALAEGGYEVAQYNIAFQLDQHYMQQPDVSILGISGEDLAAHALGMYRKAAQQGNVEAELKLGDYHYYGYGMATDLEEAVIHYRVSAEARNPQAMFNLAYMYTHGHGLSRDYHLAKRHYDQAMQASVEAWAPVRLALIELQLLLWWDAYTDGKGGDPYAALAALWGPPTDLAAAMPNWDTLLILALSVAFGVVLLLRQRQTLEP